MYQGAKYVNQAMTGSSPPNQLVFSSRLSSSLSGKTNLRAKEKCSLYSNGIGVISRMSFFSPGSLFHLTESILTVEKCLNH